MKKNKTNSRFSTGEEGILTRRRFLGTGGLALLLSPLAGCALRQRRDDSLFSSSGLSFENPLGISSDYFSEALAVVQEVLVKAEYSFTNLNGEVETLTAGWLGSCTLLNDQIALSAHHVASVPSQINVYNLEDELYEMHTDYMIPEQLQTIILNFGAVANLVAGPFISVAGMEGVEHIYPNDYEETEDWYPGPDYALFKLPATNHGLASIAGSPLIKIGDSDSLEVGSYIAAVGNTRGQGILITDGIVSNTGNFSDRSYFKEEMVAITSPIAPGNSGGAGFAYDGEFFCLVLEIIAGLPSAQNFNIGERINNIQKHLSDEHKVELLDLLQGQEVQTPQEYLNIGRELRLERFLYE